MVKMLSSLDNESKDSRYSSHPQEDIPMPTSLWPRETLTAHIPSTSTNHRARKTTLTIPKPPPLFFSQWSNTARYLATSIGSLLRQLCCRHLVSTLQQQAQRGQLRTKYACPCTSRLALPGLPPTTAAAAQWSKGKHRTAQRSKTPQLLPIVSSPSFPCLSPFPPALLHFHRRSPSGAGYPPRTPSGWQQPKIRRLGSYSRWGSDES